jgi:hypothetical protein
VLCSLFRVQTAPLRHGPLLRLESALALRHAVGRILARSAQPRNSRRLNIQLLQPLS